MRRFGLMMRDLACASALMLVATPAFAGDEERALAAIAQAQGKIDAALRVKAGDTSPDMLARAQASLRLAQEELKSGHEQKAIQAALDSQQFADSAIGRSQQRSDSTAEGQAAATASAQQEAAVANARADAAEQAAAVAAADAQAARSAPPIVAMPTPSTTTVTTETVKTAAPAAPRIAAAPAKRKTVQRTRTTARTRPATVEKTTTTVTTRQGQ